MYKRKALEWMEHQLLVRNTYVYEVTSSKHSTLMREKRASMDKGESSL
jgi:hypothetical protein